MKILQLICHNYYLWSKLFFEDWMNDEWIAAINNILLYGRLIILYDLKNWIRVLCGSNDQHF